MYVYTVIFKKENVCIYCLLTVGFGVFQLKSLVLETVESGRDMSFIYTVLVLFGLITGYKVWLSLWIKFSLVLKYVTDI